MSRNRRDEDRNTSSYWGTAAAVGVAGAMVGGLAYWLTKKTPEELSESQNRNNDSEGTSSRLPRRNGHIRPTSSVRREESFERIQRPIRRQDSFERIERPIEVAEEVCFREIPSTSGVRVSNYLTGLLQRVTAPPSSGLSIVSQPSTSSARRGGPRADPKLTNMNGLLDDIYTRYIALKDDEFEQHYNVFNEIFFNNLHKSMKDVDPYYKKYSSTVQFAGSHFDKLRIKKPDEFDMDIVIGLPLNIQTNPLNSEESDIVIEPKSAGFVQLRMGTQFQNLHRRDGVEWLNNKAAFEWKDDKNYLLRSNFINWFKGVVDRALNKHGQRCGTPALFYVQGVPYTVDKSESGPAVTLYIKNNARGFKLDVDLVPALKFPENRWPITNSYRAIPDNCKLKEQPYWMVVPKPNKAGQNVHDENRSWRIALHNQERKLLYNTNNLRQGIRLMKKLRDAQGMDKIASYYVKTLFFWEIMQRDQSFWSITNPAEIFKMMVKKLHEAIQRERIPYFWNKDNNLIAGVDKTVLYRYETKLRPLLQIFEQPSEYKQVARYLLTADEFLEYNARFLHV